MGYAANSGIGNSEGGELRGALIVVAFLGIALYNVLELNVIILATFKTRKGLYFWSFIVATNGIAPYSIGFLLKHLELTHNSTLYLTLIEIGWVTMITGQSVVLYSRLHLVLHNRLHMKLVLAMIIIDAFILHVPTIVFTCGSNSANPDPWVVPYAIYERVQVTVFFLQELIISGLYIKHTFSFFRTQDTLYGNAVRKMRNHLIWVNILIIVLDITILGLQYADFYEFQTSYKALVYSVKLKMEFSILNSLLEMTRQRTNSGGNASYVHSFHNRTNPGVRLDTFDGDKRNRASLHSKKNTSGVGYNAFVKIGDENDNIAQPREGIVITTATKVVHDSRVDIESERDVESINMTAGRTSPVKQQGLTPSSSSSEVQFATKF